MDGSTLISFEQYKNNFKPTVRKDEVLDKEKILADAEIIKNAHQNRQQNNTTE